MNIFNKLTAVICALLISLISWSALAENDVKNTEFSQAELEQMLAPIALYPDSLLTHILIASTYPLEIIQAQRWLTNNADIEAANIAAQIEDKDWDASVKALMPFPRVIKRLSDDLQWTQKLGDAFLQDEKQLLASIQNLRQKADQAGNLDQMDNMDITRKEKNIVIQPVQREVVYVPYYDSRYVYGDWYWANYPPIYWQTSFNNDHYYRSHYSPFYWHSGIEISFNYFFSGFNWNEHHVVVANHYSPRRQYSYGYQLNRHQSVRWQHNPSHRRGVGYRNNAIKERYHSNRPSIYQRQIANNRGHQLLVKNTYTTANKMNFVQKKHSPKAVSKYQQLTKQMQVARKAGNRTLNNKNRNNNNNTNNHLNKSNKNVSLQRAEQTNNNFGKRSNYQPNYQPRVTQKAYKAKRNTEVVNNMPARNGTNERRYANVQRGEVNSSKNRQNATRSYHNVRSSNDSYHNNSSRNNSAHNNRNKQRH